MDKMFLSLLHVYYHSHTIIVSPMCQFPNDEFAKCEVDSPTSNVSSPMLYNYVSLPMFKVIFKKGLKCI